MAYGVGSAIAEGIQSGWQMGREANLDAERKRQFDADLQFRQAEEGRRVAESGRLQSALRVKAAQDRRDFLEKQATDIASKGGEVSDALLQELADAHLQVQDMQGQLASTGTLTAAPAPTAAPQRPNVASADLTGAPTTAAAPQGGVGAAIGAQPVQTPPAAVSAPAAAARTPQQMRIASVDQASQDLASRLQTGQVSLSDVKPGDFALMIASATKRHPSEIGNVRSSVADFNSGMATGNNGLMMQGLNGLFGPQINRDIGQPSPYGGNIVSKQIIGLDPALSADGSIHSDRVIPRLRVTTDVKGPDGTPLHYDAPLLTDSGKVAAIPVEDAMNHVGAAGALAEVASHPDAQALLAEGAKDPRVKAYLEDFRAQYAPLGKTEVLENRIKAYMRRNNVDRETAEQRFIASGEMPRPPQTKGYVAQTLEAAQKAVDDGTYPSLAAALKDFQDNGLLKQPTKYSANAVIRGGGGGAAEEKLTPGGLAVAVELASRGVPIPGGFSKAGISRANAILNSMAEQEEGGAGSGAAASGIAGGKADVASLGFQQKRVDAIESGMKKIQKDITLVNETIGKGNIDWTPWLNKPINALRSATGSGNLAAYALAVHQVATEYERQITGGQLSVAQLHAGAQEQADKILNGSMNVEQVQAVLPIMLREIENGRQAAHEQLAEIRTRLKGGGADGQPKPEPKPTAAPTWTDKDEARLRELEARHGS